MRISKIDTIRISCKRVREENPLGSITCDLSLIFCAPDAPMEGGLVSLNTDQVKDAIVESFTSKFVNWGEVFPLVLCDGKLILKVKVTKVESFRQEIS